MWRATWRNPDTIANVFGLNGGEFALVAFIVAAILTEFVGVLGQTIGGGRRYDGPMGKSDRAAAIGLLAFGIAVGVPGGAWLDWAIGLLALLALWTSVNRARGALAGGGS